MNRTLLLIICDFLLLNLLALTRWEKAEPPRAQRAPVPEVAANTPPKSQDLVDVMQLSLEDERAAREALAQQLAATRETLATREGNLGRLEAERSRLGSSLEETQRAASELEARLAQAARDANVSRERMEQLQRDLEQKEAESARQRESLASLEKQQAEARERIEGLVVAVRVAEQEKQMLRETAESFRDQVEIERQERQKVQEAATQLAQGVGQLAEKSGELTKEIRDNRPINANVLFNEFLASRVQTQFASFRSTFLGPINRSKEARTIFVSDGTQVYALLHIEDTTFNLRENPADWERLSATLSKGSYRESVSSLHVLSADPRIVALPVDPQQAAALGVKIYQTALDPFRFPEAVLISNGGAGYGEAAFKLDASQPGYVRMDNRLVKRLFGDFSPSRGDLVLSKTGELLGIMVNSEYCVVIDDFLVAQTIRTGDDISSQQTSQILGELRSRLRRLPMKLQ